MKNDADFLITQLDLAPHPEGGYFRENYRCDTIANDRNLVTSIYFLLRGNQKSKFHVLKSDEIWYYHAGAAINLYLLSPDGMLEMKKLGPDLAAGEEFHVLIRKGITFAADLPDTESFALASCIVSPGFTFDDFKLYTRDELTGLFPEHEKLIREFT